MSAIELHHGIKMLYWNCNGIGADWDGNTSRKFQLICAAGKYDIIALVETHLRDPPHTLPGEAWVFSEPVGMDSHAGAALWIGPRLRAAVREIGREGARLAWARLQTGRGYVVVTAHYVAHMFRTQPSREDCYRVMEIFLRDKVRPADRLIYALDANSRMRRGNPPITGAYCTHERSDEGGVRLEGICAAAGLCAASTMFKPEKGDWSEGGGAVTFIPRDSTKQGAQIDYVLVKQRFLSDVQNSKVRWEFSIRHAKKFDHGAIEVQLKLTVKRARSGPAARDVSLLRSNPAVAKAFDDHLAQGLKDRGLDMAQLVTQCHPVISVRAQRYEKSDREPSAAEVKACAGEYAQCEAGHWRKIAKRWAKTVKRAIKRGAKLVGEEDRMSLDQFRALAAKMRALQATAPKERGKTPSAELKRLESALWEELNRPTTTEHLRLATDGSHSKGKEARWGVAVWEGEGPVMDLYGPVIVEGSASARAHAQSRDMLSSEMSMGAKGHSNNTGEIQAACEGLLELLHREPGPTVWMFDSEMTADVASSET